MLVDAAAPDAQGVDVGPPGRLQELMVTRVVDPRVDRIHRRPIHALEKNFTPVHRHDERRGSVRRGLLNEVHRADAEAAAPLVQGRPGAAQDRSPRIQGLCAVVVRPPQLGLGHGEALHVAVAGRVARQRQPAGLAGDGQLELDRPGRAVVVLQLDPGLQFGGAVRRQRHRAHIHVGDLRGLDQQPGHGFPNPDRDQSRRDVPPVAGLGLAHLQAQRRAIAPHLGRGLAARRRHRRTEADLEPVRPRLHAIRHIQPEGGEHVAVPPHFPPVEVDRGKDIQPLEAQVQPLPRTGRRRNEVGAIPPVPLLHPPAMVVVGAVKRVRNQSGALIVEVHVAGHLGRHPALREGQG